jgi:hypothetical protein
MNMLVKGLIEMLQKLDCDALVVMSSDGEGNEFSPLSEVTTEMYEPYNEWSGEIYPTVRKAEKPQGAELVIVLWPVN